MLYTLIKNGQIISGKRVLAGDILIRNNRILHIDTSIKRPTPDTIIINAENKYLLPGLIHYNCPFLKSDDDSLTGIYIALSHGATFIMDTLSIKNEVFSRDLIASHRDACTPIITDFSIHLDAMHCSKLSKKEIDFCYIYEGITSLYLRHKHFAKVLTGKLDELLAIMSDRGMLLICEHKKSENNWRNKLAELTHYFREKNVIVLFVGVNTVEELEIIEPGLKNSNNIYAAFGLSSSSQNKDHSKITDLKSLLKYPNLILAPPALEPPSEKTGKFIENKLHSSFLSDLLSNGLKNSDLTTFCEMYAGRPAKLLGIYPQKGALQIGADADIIIWDPEEHNVSITYGANTSLLRKDIWGLILNGSFIDEEHHINSDNFKGKFIYRNTIITESP